MTTTAEFTTPAVPAAISNSLYASASAQWTYSAETTTKGVVLTSSIEPSFYKGDLRSDVPATAPDAYRQPHKRNDDGSMEVSSVANYSEGGFNTGPRKGYYGHADLTANVYGFNPHGNPWTISTEEWTTSEGRYGWLSQYVRCLNFQAKSASSFPFTSDHSYAGYDNSDGRKYEAKYKIKWHLEQENHVPINGTNDVAADAVGYESITEDYNPKGAKPGTDLFLKIKSPSATIKANGDAVVSYTGVVLGLGSLAASIYLKDYPAIPPILGDILGPAMGLTWSLLAPTPLDDVQVNTDEAAFRKSINEQRVINRANAKGEVADIPVPNEARIHPTELADRIKDEDIPEFFANRKGFFTVKASKHVEKVKTTYRADGYGAQGYIGDVFPSKTTPESQYTVVQFSQGQ